jgi:Cellulase M and related proteins|nr:MAG: cellulase M family protein [Candidatus Nanosalinarum sp. J07AB56]
MSEELVETLADLTDTTGVSGTETRIAETIKDKIDGHVDEAEIDEFGNLVCRKGSGDKTLMVAAHMDQIGLTVSRIDEEGFIHITKTGGIYPKDIVDQRFQVITSEGNDVPAVVATKPVHLLRNKEERQKLPEMDEIVLDVGAEDEEDVRDMGIRVGDTAAYDTELTQLGNDYVTSRCLDNRVGCLIAIEALKDFDADYELVTVFSAQEEVGTKGATVSAFGVDPDAALAIDTGIAGDVPQVDPDEAASSLGDGVSIDVLQAGGRGLITPPQIKDWLIDTAEESDVDYSRRIVKGGATDAASIYTSRDGIPSGSIGATARSIHSPVAVTKMSDIEQTIDFTRDAYENFSQYF